MFQRRAAWNEQDDRSVHREGEEKETAAAATSSTSFEDITFDVCDKRILSIDYHKATLAVTCLDFDARVAYIYEDFEVSNPNVYLYTILDDLKPNLVFASSRCTQLMFIYLREKESQYEFQLFTKIVADFTRFDLQQLADSFINCITSVRSRLFLDLALKSSCFKLSVC